MAGCPINSMAFRAQNLPAENVRNLSVAKLSVKDVSSGHKTSNDTGSSVKNEKIFGISGWIIASSLTRCV